MSDNMLSNDNSCWQPSLQSDLLFLRPLQISDFEALFQAASDPLIWEQHPATDRYTKPVFKLFFKDAIESGGALVIIDKLTNKVIGTSRYFGFNAATNDVEIGWTFLSRDYWGGKYNSDLKRLMIEHAFQFVDTVNLMVGPENHRSQKAVEKIGGVRERELDDKGRVVFRVKSIPKGI